jgi:hypothetical protein
MPTIVPISILHKFDCEHLSKSVVGFQIMIDIKFSLFCTYSSAPGCDWSAWIGFRETKKGFSMLAKFSDNGARLKKVAESKRALTPRSAVDLLRNNSAFLLGGDFRSYIEIEGAVGYQADLLKLAWMNEEYPYHTVCSYLFGLADKDVERLANEIGKLCETSTLDWVSELLDSIDWCVGDASPDFVKLEASIAESHTPLKLNSLLEALREKKRIEDEEYEKIVQETQAKRDKKLAPFRSDITKSIQSEMDKLPHPGSYTAGLVYMQKQRRLTGRLEDFIITYNRFPSHDELIRLFE